MIDKNKPIETRYKKKYRELGEPKKFSALHRTLIPLMNQEVDDIKNAYNELYPGDDIMVLLHIDNGRGVIIHKSGKKSGYVQLTSFDEDGFIEDTQYESKDAAIQSAMVRGYLIPNKQRGEKMLNSFIMKQESEKWM